MVSETPDDDVLTFIGEAGPASKASKPAWKILIVDDERDVHEATELALHGVLVEGRALEFLHAYSAREARQCLETHRDFAVMFLDVVMESDDAGLKLVRYLRDDLGNQALRIILRTGQPGYAPEIDTIRCYDINDYKTKTEMTRIRLFTSLTAAVRCYSQIHQLEANRRGLELIVSAGKELSRPTGLQRFAEGVVTQLCALLRIDEEGIVCAASGTADAEPYVLAAAGRYAEWIGLSLARIPDDRVRRELERTLGEQRHSVGETTCLYFEVPGELSLSAFVDVDHPLCKIDQNLLQVFCGNILVAFENTQLIKRISDLAFEDPLLKLPNRNSFMEHIDQRHDGKDTLAMVDIDGFADINSILDQDFGDAVLQVVAARLRQSFSSTVEVARIGSDVFGIHGPKNEVNAERIVEIFSSPFVVDHESLRLSSTTGLVQITPPPLKAVELLRNAGAALKQAKLFNRGKALYFEAGLAAAARERMQMLSRLRLAFSAERLFLVYQPFVHLGSGQIVGAEALLRWRTEQGEFVSPDRFIPLAEQSGMMVAIGDWVMRSALQFLKRLVDLGHHDFRMAINVSHTQFREPDFVQKLVAAIGELGVAATHVEIELTESVAIDNIELIERKLSAVRAAGVAIAIDDFGTGYSSLNILRQLNVDRLKIDRSFISGKDSLNGEYGIAGMVIQLANQLGLDTIAEGIETQEQLEQLLGMGCRDGQGYFFSKPLTCEQFEEFIGRS